MGRKHIGFLICLVMVMCLCECGTDEHKYNNSCNSPTTVSQTRIWYDINPTRVTDLGILVDDTGHNIDLAIVDEAYEEIMECLTSNFLEEDYGNFNPSGLTVKIPGQYIMSCPGDQQQQLLLDEAPDTGCENKGLIVSQDCTCRWRCRIQNTCVAITTPSLYMLKQPLIEIITGRVGAVWYDPKLSECAKPNVDLEGNRLK